MNFQTVVNSRRSIRWFQDREVATETLQTIVETAQKVPSFVNSQPVRVVIATGNTLATIREQHLQSVLNQTPSQSVLPYQPIPEWDDGAKANIMGWFASTKEQIGDDWGTMMGKAGANLYNAQAIVYLTLPKDYPDWSLVDLGAFSEALMLTAQDAGVDSLPAYEFVKFADDLMAPLKLTDDQQVVMGVGLGYRDEDSLLNQIRSGRMDTKSILTILD